MLKIVQCIYKTHVNTCRLFSILVRPAKYQVLWIKKQVTVKISLIAICWSFFYDYRILHVLTGVRTGCSAMRCDVRHQRAALYVPAHAQWTSRLHLHHNFWIFDVIASVVCYHHRTLQSIPHRPKVAGKCVIFDCAYVYTVFITGNQCFTY